MSFELLIAIFVVIAIGVAVARKKGFRLDRSTDWTGDDHDGGDDGGDDD